MSSSKGLALCFFDDRASLSFEGPGLPTNLNRIDLSMRDEGSEDEVHCGRKLHSASNLTPPISSNLSGAPYVRYPLELDSFSRE